MAFALSILPPRYVRSRPSPPRWEAAWSADIDGALSRGRARVTRHPKHSRWAPESFRGRVHLADFALQEGAKIIKSGAYACRGDCRCEACEEDILALALSRTGPKYGVTRNGTGRFPHRKREELRCRLADSLDTASISVAARPRHRIGKSRGAADRCLVILRQIGRRGIGPS